ncbi:uncharacterized protein LOC143264084 [Megachile rotundata]|uniref:uncharacterized protein LOC143264084 n=1 Tax=Megachile rotundata TaxID=143995 RepID=UPI003FD34DC6
MAIKLPEMRLPTFDRKIEEWASYFDSFSSMIDQNTDDRRAACIQCLSTTDANYIDAIELLKEKFDCKWRILLKYCDGILTLPKLAKDTSTALGELVDTVRQNLRSLKNLQVDIRFWDCILISIIRSKISADTAWHWEVSLKHKQMPSYNHLLDFFDKRTNCAATIQSTSSHSSSQNRVSFTKPSYNKNTTHAQAFVTTNNVRTQDQNTRSNNVSATTVTSAASSANIVPIKCPLCQGAHGIWRCEKFHALSVNLRLDAVKKTSLYQNCLRHERIPDLCKKGSCRICHQPQNKLLHQPKQVQPGNSAPATKSVPPDEQVATTSN